MTPAKADRIECPDDNVIIMPVRTPMERQARSLGDTLLGGQEHPVGAEIAETKAKVVKPADETAKVGEPLDVAGQQVMAMPAAPRRRCK